ncbi:hypothetical protein G7Y89_g5966 [Cudoniella acicularis]|uniref:Uncharacterized protein n=1 Tax=Cudoniella acicularis TaxID=354080 RepID=A0A8H4W5Z6_9HELO|nr:hypothetical protein G7Y89_g5966 [Cudoniella acicularis]
MPSIRTHKPVTVVSREHIIVGIDIGYTYTGVALGSVHWVKSDQIISPFVIQKWPGSGRSEERVIVNKVPTRLTYKARDQRVRSWGFLCPERGKLGEGEAVSAFFKFFLDKTQLDELNKGKPEEDQEDMENVRKWFTDFLSKLREHIIDQLSSTWEVDLGTAKIEYIFSLPTSWETNGELINDFGSIIQNAGYGQGENCSTSTGLTEAVASAVFTAKSVGHKFEVGELVLVCDAGGGTTDICVLRVTEFDNEIVVLETVISPLSIYVGSVEIDKAFETAFDAKLKQLETQKPEIFNDFVVSKHAAHDVSTGAFQKLKVGWGKKRAPPIPTYFVPGKWTNEEFLTDDEMGNSPARINFLPNELDAMFDKQIQEMFVVIDKTIESVGKKVPNIILTGGLGSSKYVQSKFEDYYSPRIKILFDPKQEEPPLSVCKGLVFDRMQRLLHGISVIRRCQTSYGILYNKLYSSTEHKGRKYDTDPVDGKKYVQEEIHWFIETGQEIKDDAPIRLQLPRHTSLENPERTWTDTIVTSALPPDRLKRFATHHGLGHSHVVAVVTSEYDPANLITKRTHKWVGRKFLHGEYEVRIVVDEDNLKIETRVDRNTTGQCEVPQVPWDFTEENASGST